MNQSSESEIQILPGQFIQPKHSSLTFFNPVSPVSRRMNCLKILVCSTGSVATIKLSELITRLKENIEDIKLQVILTERAKHFCTVSDLMNLPIENVYSDNDWKSSKESMTHEVNLADKLAEQADVLLIAPLDANTLAKIANGLCDNLLTSIVRVWDYTNKIAACCPAMNTQMWAHPITEQHIKQIESFGFFVIPPIKKKLMCGDTGVGAMAEPNDIALAVKRYASFRDDK